MTKYIFVTGGVISGIGKGVTSASIGSILQMLGENNIIIKKLDPYLNIDPGTINPIEHGEIYVTSDGTETDLDLGYYERFLEIETSKQNSTSSGKLYQKLLEKERAGCYLGKTVQMIPHFTDIIKEFICENWSQYDYIICEIGGSIGDIEAMAFYEALRQLRNDIGDENILFIHLTYLVYYSTTNEIKTKPTQNSIRELQQVGIIPEMLICRTEHLISNDIKKKLSLYTNIPESNIIEALDVSSIYQVPLHFINQKVHLLLIKKFKMKSNALNISKWEILNTKIDLMKKTLTIGLLGKYTALKDSYKSLLESLFHAGIYHNYKINIRWINAREKLNENLKDIKGVIIPGGFGTTGIENMINYIQFLRESKIPTLGICLGMQLMVIEFFRNVLGLKNAGSSEMGNHSHNVISELDKYTDKKYGGTMRLGDSQIKLSENSQVKKIYQKNMIVERHRHRYSVNSKYSLQLKEKGFYITGLSTDNLIEIVEMDKRKHPWYIGCQYHPEYKSTPFNPHPLFISYISSLTCSDK